MSETLGVRLRLRREQQGINLAAIADRTKIKSCLLEALERDDVSRWPTGIYRRAYFRSYAEAIGADVDAALREFLATHPDPHEADDPVDDTLSETRPGSAPPTRIGMILSAAIAATPWRRRAAAPAPGTTRAASLPAREAEVQAAAVAPTACDDAIPGAEATPAARPVIEEGDARLSATASAMPVVPEPAGPDLQAVARWCTAFARADHGEDPQPLLREAAQLLGVRGLVIWSYDEDDERLRPVLAHGYSRRVLNRLPPVDRDEDNPTATAFRLASIVGLSDEESGALVVPLSGPDGCEGVLALELPRGAEQHEATRAAAAIVAAMLVSALGTPVQRRAERNATVTRPERPRVVVDSRAVPAPCR